MITGVHAVRATMVDGSTLDLLLFAQEIEAQKYLQVLQKDTLLGFDRLEVVQRRIIGDVIDRRRQHRVERFPTFIREIAMRLVILAAALWCSSCSSPVAPTAGPAATVGDAAPLAVNCVGELCTATGRAINIGPDCAINVSVTVFGVHQAAGGLPITSDADGMTRTLGRLNVGSAATFVAQIPRADRYHTSYVYTPTRCA